MRSNHRSLTVKSAAGHIEPPAETFTSGFVRETALGYTVVSDEAVIRTALELLSRRISRGPLLASPQATREYLRLRFADLQHEVFCLLYLDLCEVDSYVELSGVSRQMVDLDETNSTLILPRNGYRIGARPNWSLGVAFERVYCISNYYDGPKEGIADYEGRPHRYLYEWDELADDYAKTFTLAPVDAETMKFALEQWNIWRKWEIAFRRGAVDQKTHPGFGGIDARYDELKSMLQSRYKQLNRLPQSFYANFQSDLGAADPEVGWSTSTKVEWTNADTPHEGTSDRR